MLVGVVDDVAAVAKYFRLIAIEGMVVIAQRMRREGLERLGCCLCLCRREDIAVPAVKMLVTESSVEDKLEVPCVSWGRR